MTVLKRWNGSAWEIVGAAILDGVASDIQPLGPVAIPGTAGKAADAGHVHPNTGVASSATPSFTGLVSTSAGITLGAGSPSLSATTGFAQIASSAGAPTGTPVFTSGFVPFRYDTTNHKMWAYDGSSWRGVDDGFVRSTAVSYTMVPGDRTIIVTATGQTITLPAVAIGRRATVKMTVAGTTTVTPASGTIDGAANDTITIANQAIQYVSDGINWFRTALNVPSSTYVDPTQTATFTKAVTFSGGASLTDKTSASNIALRAAAADAIIYVSKAAGASDANDGLSMGSAKATIAGALTALGSSPGTIQLGAGNFVLTTADASGNGVTLANAGTCLRGMGNSTTTITLNGTFTWGIKLQAAYCQLLDVYVVLGSSGTVTYGVGVSTLASPGSAQGCIFRNVTVANGITGKTMTAGFALGPDFPGASNIDIANTVFESCSASTSNSGVITYGFSFGNGTTGNVTQNWMTNSGTSGCVNGVYFNGGAATYTNGGATGNTTTDFYIGHGSIESIVIQGHRSENGNMLLYYGYVGTESGGVQLVGTHAFNMTPTFKGAGRIIEWDGASPLTLIGGTFLTIGANTSIALNVSSGTASTFTAIGVVTDVANPYPAYAPTKYQRVILNAGQVSGGAIIPLPAFACVVDGQSSTTALSEIGLRSTATSTTVAAADRTIIVTATAQTITLPAVAVGRKVTVKLTVAGTCTVTPASGTVDGAATDTINTQWQSVDYLSDGTNWFKV